MSEIKHKFIEFFTDGKLLSWTRLIATPIIISGCIGFLYSIFIKYIDGLTYSVGMVTLGCGLKGFQTKFETDQLKISNKDEEKVLEEGV